MTVVTTITPRERKSDVAQLDGRIWCSKLVGGVLRGTILLCSFVSIGMFGYLLGQQQPMMHALSIDDNYNSSSKNNSPHYLRRRRRSARKTDSSSSSSAAGGGMSLDTRKAGTKTWSTTPPNWQDMTFIQLRSHYACHEHAHNPNKPLPTLEEWMFLKKQFRELVLLPLLVDDKAVKEAAAAYNNILDSPVEPTNGYSHGTQNLYTNTPPPYHAKQSSSDGKGRGLFATRYIHKGELVHDGPRSSVSFPNAMSYRRLITNLPRNIACDVTEWAWTQQLERGGDMKIVLDLNIAALMNSSNEPNIGPKDKYTTQMYALRDINMGEEIVHDYSVYTVEYKALGL